MTINEISLNKSAPDHEPRKVRVGEPIIEGGHMVEKIVFHSSNALFNKGREIEGGCYAIFFADIPARRLIKQDIVASIEVVKDQSQKSSIPEPPE